MPFVLFLFFGIWFLVICANDKSRLTNKAKRYYANYTEYRFQEEYLLAFEIWLEYKKDGERSDPMRDAEIEAARRMYEAGYMPRHSGGRTAYANNYQGTQYRYSIDHTYPKRSILLNMRKSDELNRHGVLYKMGPSNDTTLREMNRADYNRRIDIRWGELIEKIAYDEYVNRRRWPLTLAEEYMYSCRFEPPIPPDPLAPTPETLRQIVRPDPLAEYRLQQKPHPVHRIRRRVYGRPSSLKPVILQDAADCSKDYVYDSEFDPVLLEQLLERDRADWEALGHSDKWPIYERYIMASVDWRQQYTRWPFPPSKITRTVLKVDRAFKSARDDMNQLFPRRPYLSRGASGYLCDTFEEELYHY